MNRARPSSILIAALLFSASVAAQQPAAPAEKPHDPPHPTAATAAKAQPADVQAAMRKLWEDHITYTRNYIISALADLPDTDAVAKRLLANQDEIGNAIKPYYGDAAGVKLAVLLKDHINIATEVVAAAKGNKQPELAAAQAKWTQNGKDIAAFLAGANPNWKKADLESMLQTHLDLTTGEVVARLKKDWAADIKAYDEGHAHMLMFADALTAGIAKQFPDRFATAQADTE